MTIEFDSNLPPLHPKPVPVVPVETLVTVESVTLTAGDVPTGILREFYTHLLGLTFASADAQGIHFTHNNRHILLSRDHPSLGRLGLLIRTFNDAITRFRERSIPYELLHADAGLSRTAILRDPAGNWIHLLETRPF